MMASFPIIDCKSCAGCTFHQNMEFIRLWICAWGKDEPLPECPDYKERYWRGQELRI
jgi:hypothetical protein